MNWRRIRRRCASRSGQSLLETALLLPLILLVTLNAINFGYYFVVALNLAAAPRTAVQYAAQGSLAPGSTTTLPLAGPTSDPLSVSYLAYQDMGMLAGASTANVQVCTSMAGLTKAGTTAQTTNCVTYPNAASTAFSSDTPAPDPEAPNFVLQRVDVQYKVQPLIKGLTLTIGGKKLSLFTPNLTFHRQVSMRAIN